MKPILVVQHAEIEGPAALGDALRDALRDAQCELAVVRTDLGERIPSEISEYAALVVMGGTMSAASDDDFPTRNAELALLRRALAESAPTLGVCLGAQLLAAAAGADVYVGPEPEIGWRPVTFTAAAATDPLLRDIETPLDVLHWHGETFDLPREAVHLASSALYPNQAFRLGSAAWGLQFHVEADEAVVERFVADSPGDAAAAPGGPAAVRAGSRTAAGRLREFQRLVGARFAQLARAPLGAG